MNQSKIKELLIDYKEALNRLNESLKEDLSKSSTILDGTIQRFEFTFELAWKLLRAILQERGVSTNSPKITIKEAFREKLFEDGQGWIDMLEDRNLTSHTYKQDLAKEIYERIKNKHIKLLNSLRDKSEK
jgi:nucleotidyltransferase substrate binding protein (TIGR01987 family)